MTSQKSLLDQEIISTRPSIESAHAAYGAPRQSRQSGKELPERVDLGPLHPLPQSSAVGTMLEQASESCPVSSCPESGLPEGDLTAIVAPLEEVDESDPVLEGILAEARRLRDRDATKTRKPAPAPALKYPVCRGRSPSPTVTSRGKPSPRTSPIPARRPSPPTSYIARVPRAERKVPESNSLRANPTNKPAAVPRRSSTSTSKVPQPMTEKPPVIHNVSTVASEQCNLESTVHPPLKSSTAVSSKPPHADSSADLVLQNAERPTPPALTDPIAKPVLRTHYPSEISSLDQQIEAFVGATTDTDMHVFMATLQQPVDRPHLAVMSERRGLSATCHALTRLCEKVQALMESPQMAPFPLRDNSDCEVDDAYCEDVFLAASASRALDSTRKHIDRHVQEFTDEVLADAHLSEVSPLLHGLEPSAHADEHSVDDSTLTQQWLPEDILKDLGMDPALCHFRVDSDVSEVAHHQSVFTYHDSKDVLESSSARHGLQECLLWLWMETQTRSILLPLLDQLDVSESHFVSLFRVVHSLLVLDGDKQCIFFQTFKES